jgi:stalled ribosome alternative rescue factor ArfA
MDHLEKSNQKRRWVRDNCAIYQHPEIALCLDEPLQQSQGKIQDEAVRSTLYHILFEDYLEHNEHGVINYSIYKNDNSDVWVYVSVSDEPLQDVPYGAYGPLPKGTEYRSYQSDQQLRFLEISLRSL